MKDYGPSASELRAICGRLGCQLVAVRQTPSGQAFQIECPSHSRKVDLLDALASYDSRGAELRGLVEAMAAAVGPGKPELAAGLLEHVQKTVRFTGEPIETFAPSARTLFDTRIGDCDDMVRALVALLRSAGIRARLATFGANPDVPTHVTAQAFIDGAWRWLEPTIAALPGEHPYAAAARLGIPIDGLPSSGAQLGATGSSVDAWAAPIVAQAFMQELFRKGKPAERQYVQAVARGETYYGKSWKGAMVGSHNWGAVQCTKSDTSCAPYQDSQSSGQTYAQAFKVYPDDFAGAQDVVHNVCVQRPITARVLAGSMPSVFRASYAMRRERYYGGFCPVATKQFGAAAANNSFAHPDAGDAERACMKEAVTGHATAMWNFIQGISAATGEPVALELGTFDDADRWWRGGAADSGGGLGTVIVLGAVAAAAGGAYWYARRRAA